MLAAPLPLGCVRPHNTLAPLRFDDRAVGRVLASRARRRRLAGALDAADLRWISGYVSVKDAGSGALAWHQDWWCWDHPMSFEPSAAQVALLCYLADTDPGNGALRVLPGSHRRSTPLHAALSAPDGDDHVLMRAHPGQVTVAARAGDAVVIDYRLLHGTHANRSARRRDAVLLNFTPRWRTLPEEIRAHLIRHPSQPRAGERGAVRGWQRELLPTFDGRPRDLPLSRRPPDRFPMA